MVKLCVRQKQIRMSVFDVSRSAKHSRIFFRSENMKNHQLEIIRSALALLSNPCNSIKSELEGYSRTCSELKQKLAEFLRKHNYTAEAVRKRLKNEWPEWNSKITVKDMEEFRRKTNQIKEEIETEISRLKVSIFTIPNRPESVRPY